MKINKLISTFTTMQLLTEAIKNKQSIKCLLRYKWITKEHKEAQILLFLVREIPNPLIQSNLKKICKILTISFNRCATLWMSLLLAFHKIKIKIYKVEESMTFKLLNNRNLNSINNKWKLPDILEIIDLYLEILEEVWEWVEWGQWTARDLEVQTFCNLEITQEMILNEVQLQHMMAVEVVCKTLWRLMSGPNQECYSLSFQKWIKKVT